MQYDQKKYLGIYSQLNKIECWKGEGVIDIYNVSIKKEKLCML